MNLNLSGASDSFFFQWCPNLEEAEDAAKYSAIILSRWVGLQEIGKGGKVQIIPAVIEPIIEAPRLGHPRLPCQPSSPWAMCPLCVFIRWGPNLARPIDRPELCKREVSLALNME